MKNREVSPPLVTPGPGLLPAAGGEGSGEYLSPLSMPPEGVQW